MTLQSQLSTDYCPIHMYTDTNTFCHKKGMLEGAVWWFSSGEKKQKTGEEDRPRFVWRMKTCLQFQALEHQTQMTCCYMGQIHNIFSTRAAPWLISY